MIKYFTFLISLLSPFGIVQPYAFIQPHLLKSSVVAMAPMGKGEGGAVSSASRHVTNKVNPPGCAVNTSIATHRDGSIETRETLTCTRVTVEKPSGKISQKPAAESKQEKADTKLLNKFAASGAGRSSSSKKK
uniref:Uncharacterized protein n=1 Tax=Renouxia sp. TaxID=2485823 RepID=A0A3G3MH99_9FLOR|nr:hypothetical protein [Renouxia sp.]